MPFEVVELIFGIVFFGTAKILPFSGNLRQGSEACSPWLISFVTVST